MSPSDLTNICKVLKFAGHLLLSESEYSLLGTL